MTEEAFGRTAPIRHVTIIEARTMAADLFQYAFRHAAPDLYFEVVTSVDDIRCPDPSILFYSFINRGCDLSAIEKALARLKERFRDYPLVVVTDTSGEQIEALMKTYAVSRWMAASAGLVALVAALKSVASRSDRLAASPEPTKPTVEFNLPDDGSAFLGLTAKETRIVHLLHKGKSNKQIAYALACSESTVKVHIANMMRKLRLHNRTQLALVYQSRSLPMGHVNWHPASPIPALDAKSHLDVRPR